MEEPLEPIHWTCPECHRTFTLWPEPGEEPRPKPCHADLCKAYEASLRWCREFEKNHDRRTHAPT